MFRAKCIFCSLRIIFPGKKVIILDLEALDLLLQRAEVPDDDLPVPGRGGDLFGGSLGARPDLDARYLEKRSKWVKKAVELTRQATQDTTAGGLHSTEVAFLLLTQQPWV